MPCAMCLLRTNRSTLLKWYRYAPPCHERHHLGISSMDDTRWSHDTIVDGRPRSHRHRPAVAKRGDVSIAAAATLATRRS